MQIIAKGPSLDWSSVRVLLTYLVRMAFFRWVLAWVGWAAPHLGSASLAPLDSSSPALR
jgi:hypothetical protein